MALPSPRKDLEYIPLKHAGQTYVLVRDRLGLVAEGTAISPPLYQFLVLLDGADNELDLQSQVMAQSGGSWISLEHIQKILGDLDRAFLLESEAFARARQALEDEFVSMATRQPSLAGSAYPSEPDRLSEYLRDMVGGSVPADPEPAHDAAALVAPHIDLAVGGRAYAKAYSLLPAMEPERLIILGVGHHMDKGLFSATCKDFDTPLGRVQADRDAVAELQEAGRGCQAPNDFVHRFEHSIEFQTLFLQYFLPEGSFRLVPVLCGSAALLPEYSRQAFLDLAGGFLERLRGMLRDEARPTRLVAGVDFSHIGPKFGHGQGFAALKPQAEEHDRRLLEALCRQDADEFWSESRQVQDRFNVCGFFALACLLEALPPCRGQVLEHSFWEEQATDSGVSYAAMVFRKSPGEAASLE